MAHYEFIVIGGGLNSLVTASILGNSGKKVLLLEAREHVGGLASTEEFIPGYKCNIVNDYVNWIDPRVMSKLNLLSFGLTLESPELVRIALDTNGKHILFYRDDHKTTDSISIHSEKDSQLWKKFTNQIKNLNHFLERLYELTPPKLSNVGLKDAFSFRSILSPILKQGTKGAIDFGRIIPMMMPEFMDEWFESELLRGSLSSEGIRHITQGPFSSGTGLNFMHHHLHGNGVFHNAQFIKGGTGELANAVRLSAESANVEIKTNAKITSINVENGICTGVKLESGDTIQANQFVSGLDPINTFMNLMSAEKLSPRFRTQLKNIKYRGSTARIHFALNDLPEINGIPEGNMGTIFGIAPSISYLEKAFDASKYGQISEKPYVEFTIPSVRNPDFAPEGKHVLSATVQYAPYHLRNEKWNDGLKEKLKNNVVRVLENYFTGFSSLVESTVVFSPVDLEEKLGLTEGNLNHGEMTLDQFLFMRPSMKLAQYKTPIENLFLCGPGTHPGGGLHGANGFNAAREVLKR